MVRKYDATDIGIASPMEHVRQHPGMYVGEVDANGTLQCFAEVMQNATDEMREMGGGKILVHISNEMVTVADEGRGIPVELHPKSGKSSLETVLTHIGAGGKSGNKTAYGKRTIGVHGVGVSAVNALSKVMTVWSFRKNHWWRLDLSRGKVTAPLTKRDPPFKWRCGTIVRYAIDEGILPEPLPLKSVRHYCNIARHFDPIDIIYSDGEKEANLVARKPESLLDKYITREKLSVLLGPVNFYVDGVRAVLAWTDAADCSIQAHVAGAPVPSGTHVRGLEEAVSEAFATISPRDAKGIDAKIGLRAVIDVSVDQPSFSGQAKTSLRTASVRKQVLDALSRPLQKFLRANKDGINKVVEHATKIGDIDTKHQEMRELAKSSTTPRGRLMFPKGFLAALNTHPARRELFICEGLSALGTIVSAKLPYQEVLPLRGKMANVITKSGKLINSEMIGGILRCVGFDPSRPDLPLRVGRVILLADQDEDGKHISVLLMTVFQQACPRIFRENRIFLVDAPLFSAMSGDTMVAGNTLNEMTRTYGKLTHVTRMKGWGSCEVPLLRKFACDPNTRRLLRLLPPNQDEVRGLKDLMGQDSAARKELINVE